MKNLFKIFLLGIGLLPTALLSEDWPTYRYDSRRSGVSSEALDLPLSPAWRVQGGTPRQAWSGPAKWDAYSGNKDLQSMRNFDPAFFVTAANDSVYYGSSVDNAAHCLDARTGSERWVSFAGGAVRLPPTIVDKKAYFGSDDGNVYCMNAANGSLTWKYRPSPSGERVIGNGRMISLWPVRTGLLLEGGTLFLAAGIFPYEGIYVAAVDAQTGKEIWLNDTAGDQAWGHQYGGMAPQGYLVASSENLFVPTGRGMPAAFDLSLIHI